MGVSAWIAGLGGFEFIMVEMIAGFGERKDMFWIGNLGSPAEIVECYGWPLTKSMRRELDDVKEHCYGGAVIKGKPVKGKSYHLEMKAICAGYTCYYWIRGKQKTFNWRTIEQLEVVRHVSKHTGAVMSFPRDTIDRVFFDFGRDYYRWGYEAQYGEEEMTKHTVFRDRRPLSESQLALILSEIEGEDEFSLLA